MPENPPNFEPNQLLSFCHDCDMPLDLCECSSALCRMCNDYPCRCLYDDDEWTLVIPEEEEN
jgi:hypothetical protein